MLPHRTQLIDPKNRKLDYLRISVTDRCNLHCVYCNPLGEGEKLRHKDIFTYEEILRTTRIAASMGVAKVRLTGGEPLVRKGVSELVPRLAGIPGIKDISITTNGVLLKDKAERLMQGGIRRVNVSLDSLKRERYKQITGVDALDDVLEGLEVSREIGFDPIKINVVIMRGINDDEILDLAELSLSYPYHVRFIEYMPMCTERSDLSFNHLAGDIIKEELKELGDLLPVSGSHMDGPAERFKFKGAPGEIGLINPISHHFCYRCNRLRLTSTGHLRPCLLSDIQVDLKTPIRQGASDEEIRRIFLESARLKPGGHHLWENISPFHADMCSIGG